MNSLPKPKKVNESGLDPSTATAWAISRLDGRSTDRLIRLVRTDPDPNVRRMAAYALGQIRNKRAIAALLEVLGDRALPGAVRGMAAEHLPASFTWDAVPDLITGLRDPTPEVRFWCAYGMGFLRIRSALPRLRRLAADDYARVPGWWTVKREAWWAIKQIAYGPWEG